MKYAAVGLLVVLTGCAGGSNPFDAAFNDVVSLFGGNRPDTAAVSSTLPAVNQPSASELSGFAATSLIDGTTERFAIERVGGGIRTRQDNGCTWTRSADWFAPSDSWTRCGDSTNWHTATAQVRVIDSLYPLTVGSTGVYQRQAVSHTGRTQDRRTTCRVTGAEDVIRPGLPNTSAYVVECDDTRRVRTTWYAPGKGPIAFTQVSNSEGLEESWIRTN